MEINTLDNIQTSKHNVSVILVIIAIYFIANISFQIFASLFFRCFMGCNDFDKVYFQEAYLMSGLLVLALIEAVGLFKRLNWARVFGIVLGILLFLPHVIGDFQFGFSFTQSLLSFVTNEFDVIPALIVLYLAVPYFNKNWICHGSRSILIALILSIGAITLFGVNLQNYNQVITPALQAQRTEEQSAIQKVIKAGTVYKNLEYGFELTFPVDKTVFKKQDGKLFEFSTDMHVAALPGYTDIFSVYIEGVFSGQNSPEGIIASSNKWEPRDKAYAVTINNIPFVKIEHYPNGQSFEYVVAHNGKLFHFANYGGLKESDFDPIMQTIKFLN